jgi:hypothetical protein
MKNLTYIFILITVVLVSSCTEVIDVDVPENTEKLVVEAIVTIETDSSYVRLTKSVGYFDNKPTPLVTDAVVTINGTNFIHQGNGIYRPNSPYTGIAGTYYNLLITHNGKQYTSGTMLEPMFQIDTIIPVYREAEGFLEEGYTVKYVGIDNRLPTKYTYVRFGVKGFDSINDFYEDFRVLFDNANSKLNEPFEFEIPFQRLQPEDTSLLIFRSIDEPVFRYFQALGNRQGGGPFSTPPANLPSNIRGENVLGLFAAYDVKRYRTYLP